MFAYIAVGISDLQYNLHPAHLVISSLIIPIESEFYYHIVFIFASMSSMFKYLREFGNIEYMSKT